MKKIILLGLMLVYAITIIGCSSNSTQTPPTSPNKSDISEVRDYSEDTLLSLSMTPENVTIGVGTDVDMLSKLAYTWGYPLVRMERIAREYTDVIDDISATSYRAPLNQIGWARELATPESLDMPSANNDTLYREYFTTPKKTAV